MLNTNERPPRPTLPPAEPTLEAQKELAAVPRWVCWRYENVNGKWTKVPYQPGGKKASTTDPSTWSSYQTALAACPVNDFDGVGYVLYRGEGVDPDDVIGLDLDHCIDPVTGMLNPEAEAIVGDIDSYAEVTPSGTGLHVLTRGTLPVSGAKKNGVEFYQHGRYLTVTGNHLSWSPADIRDGQDAILTLYRRLVGETAPNGQKGQPGAVQTAGNGLTDSQLLERMFDAADGGELRDLYTGANGVYGSGSEADIRLCGALAFWTGRDAGRMDRLFRGSGRMRAKWDERHSSSGATYGQMTIDAAIRGCDDVYEPAEQHARVKLPSNTPADDDEDEDRILMRAPDAKRVWPDPMGSAAFVGLAGNTVRALQPFTEADPHGLLVSVLTAFGCMVNGPYLLHGSTVHWARLFCLVVGNTGDGRKGESWSPVRRLIQAADEHFRPRIQGGLSSGEGLIAAVRDPVIEIRKGEPVVTDEGETDKRLLVFEAEFARVLTVLERDTNTLGSIMRDAWDTGDLHVMTKVPTHVTGAHIAVVGHVTPEELVSKCNTSWITNGFLNRFLVAVVRRSQLLPIPQALDGDDLFDLARAWSNALQKARVLGRMGWTPEARRWWTDHYASFLTTETGKLGAMKARGAPIVLRVAATYAMMDGEKNLDTAHLDAAEEVWRYSERSVEYLFGESTGNATSDVIYRYLRQQQQLRKTEIHKLFNRHKEVHELDEALAILEQNGLAYRKYTTLKAGGKIETWFLQET